MTWWSDAVPVLSAARVRALDQRVIERLGLPGVALMEVASSGVARVIAHHWTPRPVVVVCGPGNNGGDGWAVARWLHGWGWPVAVWAVSEARTADARVMADVARRAGVPEVDSIGQPGLIVDALLGNGLSRPVDGPFADAIACMNASGAPVVAADVPSGLDADCGVARGACVAATRTVTFGYPKLGHYGAEATRCGELDVIDIGLATVREDAPDAVVPVSRGLSAQWPHRHVADHKTRSGHLLVVAGSLAMAGAAVLTCGGALAAGAGLVTLAVPRGAIARLGILPPEVMVLATDGGDTLRTLPSPDRFDAAVVGPGLGGGAALEASVASRLSRWWGEVPCPLLFDADALVSTHGAPCGGGYRVLTPHPGEAARMLGASIASVQEDRFGAARRLGERGTALLKGPHTLIAEAGEPVSINVTGGPSLATGGSGDVLSGVIGGLLARGVSAGSAARLGAWVHGLAGQHCAKEHAEGTRASDIVAAVPRAVATLLDGT